MTDFDTFWARYPRKTAKLDAMKAYAKARTIASAEEILNGVDRYIAGKPDYADWCHPATFLNKGRWMDEYDTPVEKPSFPDCDHDPRCNSKQWCLVLRTREKEAS